VLSAEGGRRHCPLQIPTKRNPSVSDQVIAAIGNETIVQRTQKTVSLGNVTVREEKDGKSKGEARWPTVCLSMFSITEKHLLLAAVLRCDSSAS
jgi:hypothetical protein